VKCKGSYYIAQNLRISGLLERTHHK